MDNMSPPGELLLGCLQAVMVLKEHLTDELRVNRVREAFVTEKLVRLRLLCNK